MANTMENEDIDGLINEAMELLAETNGNFGRTGPDSTREELEEAFQIALRQALNELSRRRGNGWTWCREVRIPTDKLANEGQIIVDILGRHADRGMVPIELKYVTMRQANGGVRPPSDAPAFPYDVLKDCLRCDLLLSGMIPCGVASNCGECGAIGLPKIVHAAVIGLTDFSRYWDRNDNYKNRSWARNSFEILRREENEFTGIVKTQTTNLNESIYARDRCHLSFGYEWRREWRDYLKPFRYVYLRPSGTTQVPAYNHPDDLDPDDSAYVPFMSVDAREVFYRLKEIHS